MDDIHPIHELELISVTVESDNSFYFHIVNTNVVLFVWVLWISFKNAHLAVFMDDVVDKALSILHHWYSLIMARIHNYSKFWVAELRFIIIGIVRVFYESYRIRIQHFATDEPVRHLHPYIKFVIFVINTFLWTLSDSFDYDVVLSDELVIKNVCWFE